MMFGQRQQIRICTLCTTLSIYWQYCQGEEDNRPAPFYALLFHRLYQSERHTPTTLQHKFCRLGVTSTAINLARARAPILIQHESENNAKPCQILQLTKGSVGNVERNTVRTVADRCIHRDNLDPRQEPGYVACSSRQYIHHSVRFFLRLSYSSMSMFTDEVHITGFYSKVQVKY